MRKALYILSQLDDKDVGWLAATGERQALRDGQVLITAGEPVSALYIVLDGDLAVTTPDTTVVARLSVGDVVGEMSLIEKRPPSVSVSATGAARVLAVAQTAVRERLESEVAFAARFYKALAVFLSDRLRGTVSRLGYGHERADMDREARFAAGHELDEALLDGLHVAGDRMRRLLARLEQQAPD